MYQSKSIFPLQKIETTASSSFKFAAGSYAFGFTFTFPEVAKCVGIGKIQELSHRLIDNHYYKEIPKWSKTHTTWPLPPSLSGIKNSYSRTGVEIFAVKYFLHGAVHFASKTSKALRVFQPIVYLPPEKPGTTHEISHKAWNFPVWKEPPNKIFISNQNAGSIKKAVNFIFHSAKSLSEPPSFPFMIRLDCPKILSPIKPISITVTLYSKVDPREMSAFKTLYITKLVLNLFSITDGRAGLKREVIGTDYGIISKDDLNFPLHFSEFVFEESPILGPVWKAELPQYLWEKAMIPDNVSPSFTSCAFTHNYRLKVCAGISIIPQSYPSFVTASSDVIITSGVTKARIASNRPPKYEAADASNLPTYDDAITENDGGAAPSVISQRRIYTPYKDYFGVPKKGNQIWN